MTTVLVVGASGFIGSHVCRQLSSSGHAVHAMVRPTSETGHLCNAYTHLHRADGRAAACELVRSLGDLDAIVYCANAYGRGGAGTAEIIATNTLLPTALFEAAQAADLQTFVYLDTCFTLDYPYLRPYTLSKKQAVAWGRTLADDGVCRFINLQLQHPFGEWDRPGKFIPWVIDQCLQGKPLDLTPGDQRKDFIYAGDVATAIETVIEATSEMSGSFHHLECGRGTAIPVREMVQLIHRLTSSHSELRFGALPYRESEIMHSEADITGLRHLGWTPTTSLEDGILRTIEQIRRDA